PAPPRSGTPFWTSPLRAGRAEAERVSWLRQKRTPTAATTVTAAHSTAATPPPTSSHTITADEAARGGRRAPLRPGGAAPPRGRGAGPGPGGPAQVAPGSTAAWQRGQRTWRPAYSSRTRSGWPQAQVTNRAMGTPRSIQIPRKTLGGLYGTAP